VLDLIENRPLGVLPSIDEELRMPKGSDKTWLDKLLNNHRQNPYFAPERSSASAFVVKHYAGDVCYESAAFLEKSKDQLNDDAIALLTTSGFKMLQSWFTEMKEGSGSGLGKKATLGQKFTKQLNDLMATLNQTEVT
jgi:myosin heavy subunit